MNKFEPQTDRPARTGFEEPLFRSYPRCRTRRNPCVSSMRQTSSPEKMPNFDDEINKGRVLTLDIFVRSQSGLSTILDKVSRCKRRGR
jgi:hypothetical protein